MSRGRLYAVVFCLIAVWPLCVAKGHLRDQPASRSPGQEQTPAAQLQARPQEKLARIWANEPALVRLARDKFGAEFSETDAKFFAAVTAGEWADFRPSSDAIYDTKEISSWDDSPVLNADRIVWLATDVAALKLVSSRGIWLRGAKIVGKIDLYRSEFPFSLTLYDCLLDNGMNISHAKLQELDIRNCCSAAIQARGVHVAENVYLLTSTVYGGLDFIEAQIGGDFDFSGGLAFHGTTSQDIGKPGVAINLHDATVGGDIKLADEFRAFGQVRLIGAEIGRGLSCTNGQPDGGNEAGRTRAVAGKRAAARLADLSSIQSVRVFAGRIPALRRPAPDLLLDPRRADDSAALEPQLSHAPWAVLPQVERRAAGLSLVSDAGRLDALHVAGRRGDGDRRELTVLVQLRFPVLSAANGCG